MKSKIITDDVSAGKSLNIHHNIMYIDVFFFLHSYRSALAGLLVKGFVIQILSKHWYKIQTNPAVDSNVISKNLHTNLPPAQHYTPILDRW